jgi:GNAT superfamily N-acetyltransferase
MLSAMTRAALAIELVGADAIDRLEPLWLALHAHHQAVAPALGPYVDDTRSWEVRRDLYRTCLAGPDSFALLARRDGRDVGYVLVNVAPADATFSDTWVTGDRIAEIETLLVLPDERGAGAGTALLDEVDAELARRGIDDAVVAAVAGNDAALQLYERRGFVPAFTTLTRFAARTARPAALALAAIALLVPGAFAADPVRVAEPAFPPPVAASPRAPAGGLRLQLAASLRNQITDVPAWFRRYRIVPDEWGLGDLSDVPAPPAPSRFARSYRSAPLIRAIRDRDLALLVYGKAAVGRFLVGVDRRSGEEKFALDLAALAVAPGSRPGTEQGVVWAAARGDIVYVETAHSTYAADSGRRNAYVTAIDTASGRVRWRSPALVANADTFAVVEDVLVTGYGFTAEPDVLFLLDRESGRAVGSLKLPSAPEYIALRRGKLFVRTYDHNVEVSIGRRLD